ncbi:type II toxin-antitoxin system Phd/YefM family antitoxin [Umezawaea tangerina]|uniref:Antitoxin n=1 Tax=Umezawaea tangerina TaxID=84725 RepID=A0A2T0SCA6_9PSEU|nr:type II toxin-antitoxin system prevent-host-death family antitoxin [Umezawaea tangerina]PRY31011.1 prevent-host-death family protein [Umezawaea tangerina]
MTTAIGQRELRNDNAEIMRRVEAGERFVVTRNGRPVADLVPHAAEPARPRRTLGELQAHFRTLPPVDVDRWDADRLADDVVFGADNPLEDAWRR